MMTSGPTDGAGGDTVAAAGPRPLTILGRGPHPPSPSLKRYFTAPTIVTVELGNAAQHRLLGVCEGAPWTQPPTPVQGRSRSETYQSPRSNCGSGAFTWPRVGAAFSWASAWRLPVIAACCARSIEAQHHENLARLIEHRRRFYSATPCMRTSARCSG
jgi:hypothetical protein